MIKKIKYLALCFMLFNVFMINTYAYTKDDIINLTSKINICSSDTNSLINGFKVTYFRLLNERDISEENLDKIYNNISIVKQIIEENNICNSEDLSKLSSQLKDKLYNLYKETNKIITSSPKYIDGIDNKIENKDDEVKIVIDSSSSEIKVYEDGMLINVVGNTKKLNYVGLNGILIGIILLFFSLLFLSLALKLKYRKSVIISSLIYTSIFVLLVALIFRNDISSYMDKIIGMSVSINNGDKKIVALNKKIISYPSYNSKYGVITINNSREDIYFGDDSNILSIGIGHNTNSSLPGEMGTTILSGHNTGLFKELYNLNRNDLVEIQTLYGSFTYEMVESKIVDDDNLSSIEENYDLIMYTCYPNINLYGNKRLILYFKLIKSEWLGDQSES